MRKTGKESLRLRHRLAAEAGLFTFMVVRLAWVMFILHPFFENRYILHSIKYFFGIPV